MGEPGAQSALSGWTDSDETPDTEDDVEDANGVAQTSDDSGRVNTLASANIAENGVLTDLSCPWCLAPEEEFREHDDGSTGCSNCGSLIPVDAEWYQKGDKIVL